MTDNEIIKALKKHSMDLCSNCKVEKTTLCNNCISEIEREALDLINRQQAEVERLGKASGLFKYVSEAVHHTSVGDVDFVSKEAKDKAIKELIDRLCNIQTIKAEAIKEFAERLKAYLLLYKPNQMSVISLENIDNLVKEMVGESQ